MSLINDVLRDLEHRSAKPAHPLTGPSRAVSRSRPGRRRLLGLLALAIVAGFVLHWVSGERSHDPAAPITLHASVPEPVPSPVVAMEAVVSAQSGEDATPDLPIKSIAEALPSVVPEPVPEAMLPTDTAVQASHTPPPPLTSVDEETVRRPGNTDSTAPGHARSLPTPAADSAIRIQRASPSPADEHEELESVRRALSRGRHNEAVARLTALLDNRPEHDEARLLLAHALISQGQSREAVHILDQGLANSNEPIEIARLLGRILLERGESERARRVLREHAPAPVDDPDFQQLLAAAHRQAGDHQAAVDSYRQLSEVVPGRPAVWIGLGASLEAVDDTTGAREAYARAADGNDPRAARFARQRLHAINQPDGDGR
jgi:MSHA biogenesis protein MshN